MLHVDEFIDGRFGKDNYARWVLNYMRLPSVLKRDFREFMRDSKLYCEYKGEKYKVTGASRLGDILLSKDHDAENGYDVRAYCDEVTGFSETP